jgi:hypothetical protein
LSFLEHHMSDLIRRTGPTIAVSATTTSSAAQAIDPTSPWVRVLNAPGGAITCIAFGTSSIVATAADLPLAAGQVPELLWKGGASHFAVITLATTATIYATPGELVSN